MKMPKRVFALLLALVLVVGVLPVAASAADGGSETLGYCTLLHDFIPSFSGGYIEDGGELIVGENTTCSHQELKQYYYNPYYPVYYASPSYTVSNEGVISDCGFKLAYSNVSGKTDYVALQFDFKALKPGTTKVRLKYYYNYWTSDFLGGYEWNTADVTITIHVLEGTVHTYTLSYDANGGDYTPETQTATNNLGYADFQISHNKPSLDGYIFKGWGDTPDDTDAKYPANSTIRLEANAPSKTIYAVWEKEPDLRNVYTLRYDANGGTGAPATQTIRTLAYQTVFLVSSEIPVRDGYLFKGWAKTPTATEAGYLGAYGCLVKLAVPNRTLYAVWEKNPDPGYTYSLTYDPAYFYVDGMPENESLTTTETSHEFTVPNVTPTLDEYRFLGWADTAESTEVVYKGGETITLNPETPSKTLHAVWEALPQYRYELHYYENGYFGHWVSRSSCESSYTFIIDDYTPKRNGYVLVGWADSQDATTAIYFPGDSITLTKDAPKKTIYPVWEEGYALYYDSQGYVVTGIPRVQSAITTAASYDFTVSSEIPVQSGYTFQGWGETYGATEAVYKGGETITLNPETPTKTLYAVWEKRTGVKYSEPGIKKTADVTSLARGQEVNFTLTSNVPGYLGDYLSLPAVPDPEIVTTNAEAERGRYDLKIHDEMDEGLTYKEGTLAVTVNSVVLTEEQYEKTITKNDDGTTTFLITMDLVRLCNEGVFTVQDIENAPEIIVTYTASLDMTAGAGKYRNMAWTTYPAPVEAGAVEGEKKSAVSAVYLDVYGIQVFKYDQDGNTPLEGAEFRLLAADRTTVLAENIRTKENGYLIFDGLAAGTYYVEETKAPAGYVKSDKMLEVVLPEKADMDINIATCQFANARIPHTGGEGTTQFVILGSALMGVAIALYMASQKKRSFQA